jgi:hypothetical protein
MWFTRKQQPTVIGLWYSANGIGIALGGLIGYGEWPSYSWHPKLTLGIGHIKGLASWKYEFLIIG